MAASVDSGGLTEEQLIEWDRFATTVKPSDFAHIDWSTVDDSICNANFHGFNQNALPYDEQCQQQEDWGGQVEDCDIIMEEAWGGPSDDSHVYTVPRKLYQTADPEAGAEIVQRHNHSSHPSSAVDVQHVVPLPETPSCLQGFVILPKATHLFPKMAPICGFADDPAYKNHALTAPTTLKQDSLLGNSKYIANSAYTPPQTYSRAWSCFRYTTEGELDPVQTYTPEEMTRYLFEHPLHHGVSPLTSNLRLRIQRSPPNSVNRYPTLSSHRCRFANCPAPSSAIDGGQFQVAFDESTASNLKQDPYITAAYVHLWCLERYCDFLKIVRELNIEAEDRVCPQEKFGYAPQRLFFAQDRRKKDLAEETPLEIMVREFIFSCRLGLLEGYPLCFPTEGGVEGTLNHRLAVVKVGHERTSELRQRQRREKALGYKGSSMSAHLGDLQAEVQMRASSRSRRLFAPADRKTRKDQSSAEPQDSLYLQATLPYLDEQSAGCMSLSQESIVHGHKAGTRSSQYPQLSANTVQERDEQVEVEEQARASITSQVKALGQTIVNLKRKYKTLLDSTAEGEVGVKRRARRRELRALQAEQMTLRKLLS